jgi:hypothetical protein
MVEREGTSTCLRPSPHQHRPLRPHKHRPPNPHRHLEQVTVEQVAVEVMVDPHIMEAKLVMVLVASQKPEAAVRCVLKDMFLGNPSKAFRI